MPAIIHFLIIADVAKTKYYLFFKTFGGALRYKLYLRLVSQRKYKGMTYSNYPNQLTNYDLHEMDVSMAIGKIGLDISGSASALALALASAFKYEPCLLHNINYL